MVKRIYKIVAYIFVCMLVSGLILSSCKKDDSGSGAIVLKSYGPSPALRGGELKFIGQNMDKVTSVVLPPNIEITASAFKSVTSEAIVIDVPQEAVDGTVKLVTASGDIIPKTIFSISEPISIASITPATVRPGDVVTITGDYLNLVKQVIFSSKKVVVDTAFHPQSRTQIKVKVPADARTGKVIVSNGAADPILIESASDLIVIAPAFASPSAFTPIPVRAGDSIQITGTNLDLATAVRFGGAKTVVRANFGKTPAATATSFYVPVPADAQNGNLVMIAPSGVEVTSGISLIMADPTNITTPAVIKNSAIIAINGADVDLINSVSFGGIAGTIQNGKTRTQISVKVPSDAIAGTISYGTQAGHTIAGSAYTMIVPTIANIAPLTTIANGTITVTGTDLDIIAKVNFTSPAGVTPIYSTKPKGATATSFTANVTPGAISGNITLITTNGTQIVSTTPLTVVPNVPAVPTWPAEAYLTTKLSITGTNLDFATNVIFPGNIAATMYGVKTPTLLEVYVPANVAKGIGKVQFITINNEIVTSSNINFKALGAEEVVDASLVFFDFDGKNSWWGDIGAIETNASLSVDGSSYFRVNTTGKTGWKALFFRNGKNNFPGATVGTNVSQYSIKFDINVIDPIQDADGALQIRLKGSEGDYFYSWRPWQSAPFNTTGWITVTVPISAFSDNYGWGSNHPVDLSLVDSDFGMIWNNSTTGPAINFCIDNVRFQHN